MILMVGVQLKTEKNGRQEFQKKINVYLFEASQFGIMELIKMVHFTLLEIVPKHRIKQIFGFIYNRRLKMKTTINEIIDDWKRVKEVKKVVL